MEGRTCENWHSYQEIQEMFQLKNWNEGIIEHDGRRITITVSRQPDYGSEIVLIFIVLLPVFVLLAPAVARFSSLRTFLWAVFPSFIVVGLMSLIFARLFENKCTTRQVVTVDIGAITLSRKNRLWTRTGRLNRRDVTGVTASEGRGGLGRVYIIARNRRYIVFEEVLNEDAARFAGELKRSMHL